MLIASFNANGIRPRTPVILDWIEKNAPDILCLQETKVQDLDFPMQPYTEAGYHVYFKGQKSYNGVATICRNPPAEVLTGLDDGDPDEEARFIAIATRDGVNIINTYIPQGQKPDSAKFAYKLEYYKRLSKYFRSRFKPDDRVVWVGDLNTAPLPIDVYDPERLYGSVCFHPAEHMALREIMSFGFQDVYRRHQPEEKEFTFWDYRIPNAVKRGIGWRIDHIMATAPMAEKSTAAWIDKGPRLLPKPSDHTFIAATFDYP